MLAVWNPRQLDAPFFEEGIDPYDAFEDASFFEADDDLNIRWDPRPKDFEEAIGGDDLNDCGWIGEDRDGVWITLHPFAALLNDELLWDSWVEWRFGQREITAEDFATKSNFELEARSAMIAADNRAQLRRAKNRETEGEDGDGDQG